MLLLLAQGDIESVAGMSPKALTDMLEKVSGSAAFKKDYEALEARKTEAEEQVSFLFSRKKATAAEKKQKKEQKEEAEKHLNMQRELVRPAMAVHCKLTCQTCPTTLS